MLHLSEVSESLRRFNQIVFISAGKTTLDSRYRAALARKCAGGDGFSSVACAEYVCTLPEPVKGVLELNGVYNTSSFLDLLFTSSGNASDTAVWLSENRAARWRAALHILSKKLRPSSSAILYLHGVVARQMLDIGFDEMFVTRDCRRRVSNGYILSGTSESLPSGGLALPSGS